MLAGCGTMDFTAPLAGSFASAGVAVKSFIIIGTVSASSTETHTVGPFGVVRKVEGAKITYSDLMMEAALIGADDIIDVRIKMNTVGSLKSRERIFTYTGEALAVQYISGESEDLEPVDFIYR